MSNKEIYKEIQDIKNQNLICLDFDDCIIEWNRCKNKEIEECRDELLEALGKNVKIINDFCKENNYKVFITSSWCVIINNKLELKTDEEIHNKIWKIIKKLPFIGKDPFNNREVAMDVLIENGNKIICIDDLDLEPHFEYAGDQFKMINVVNGKNLEKLKKI
jgi:hypothetical protein